MLGASCPVGNRDRHLLTAGASDFIHTPGCFDYSNRLTTARIFCSLDYSHSSLQILRHPQVVQRPVHPELLRFCLLLRQIAKQPLQRLLLF